MKHFVDKHALIPLYPDAGKEFYCTACDLLLFEPITGCIECKNYFHNHCLNVSRSIIHPSHPSHPLTLLSASTYPSGSFCCNACGKTGNGFIYSCAHCEYDIHLMCATLLPEEVKRVDEHPHDLKLEFRLLDVRENVIFACDVCGGAVGNDNWRYYCRGCHFGVHVGCVKDATAGSGGLVYAVAEGKAGTAVLSTDHQTGVPSGAVGGTSEHVNPHRHLSNERILQQQLRMARMQADIMTDGARAVNNLAGSGYDVILRRYIP